MLSRLRNSVAIRKLASARPALRDSLIRDNKVIPLALVVLALLVGFWVFAGVFVLGLSGSDRDDEQVSKRAFVSQSPELAQQSGGASASPSPAPEQANRDAESYAAYQSKDPFRELIPSADSASAPSTSDESTTGDGATDDGTTDGSSAPSDSISAPSDGSSAPSDGGGGQGGGNGGNGGNGGGQGGGGRPGAGGQGGQGGNGGGGRPGGGGQGGDGDLFDSGGSLPY